MNKWFNYVFLNYDNKSFKIYLIKLIFCLCRYYKYEIG